MQRDSVLLLLCRFFAAFSPRYAAIGLMPADVAIAAIQYDYRHY